MSFAVSYLLSFHIYIEVSVNNKSKRDFYMYAYSNVTENLLLILIIPRSIETFSFDHENLVRYTFT